MESENLQRQKFFSQPTEINVATPSMKKDDGFLSYASMLRKQAMDQLKELKSRTKETVQNVSNEVSEGVSNLSNFTNEIGQKIGDKFSGIIPRSRVTQTFGNKNPIERFSKGVNYGVDFGTKEGTPVNLPPGNWKVIESFGGAKSGKLGDPTNRGYGNSVLVQNLDTGEKLRFSHLSKVGVSSGQTIKGGLLGLTGRTGNVTGAHLDLEYYNQLGKIADVLRSKYANYL